MTAKPNLIEYCNTCKTYIDAILMLGYDGTHYGHMITSRSLASALNNLLFLNSKNNKENK